MGAAPSAELLREAPFRPIGYSSGRVVSLIPLTPEFFPSSDSPLFEQFYDSRFDPYVRYYIRDESQTDMQLDRVPAAAFSREEYYEKCMEFMKVSRVYQTNNELHEAHASESSQNHVLCPVPCAVVFQYDGPQNAPEECAMVAGTPVRVIGGVECTPKSYDGEPEAMEFELKLFVRKSAGDHNMLHALTLASHVFYEHCIYKCRLPRVPMLPITFSTLKTNVPFFCFLREVRNCVGLVGQKDQHCIWVDGHFIRGRINSGCAARLCEIMARQHRVQKRKKKSSKRGDVATNLKTQLSCSFDNGDLGTPVGTEKSTPSLHSLKSCCVEKQIFALAGFIDRDDTVIPASVSNLSAVYVVCVDTLVRVVRSGGERSDGSDDEGVLSDVTQLQVRRGNILRFVPSGTELEGSDDISGGNLVNEVSEVDANATNDVNDDAKTPKLIHGTWQVDSDISLENVLLSFLHDECKKAREASADDPHWVRDEETGEIVVDGCFYIWHFQLEGTTYYYGTVPKLASGHKKKQDVRDCSMSPLKVSEDDVDTAAGVTSRRASATSSTVSKTLTTTTAAERGGACASKADTKCDGRSEGSPKKKTEKRDSGVVRRFSVVTAAGVSQGVFSPYPSTAPLFVPPPPYPAERSQVVFVPPPPVYRSSSNGLSADMLQGPPIVYEQTGCGMNRTAYSAMDFVPVQYAPFAQPTPPVSAVQCVPPTQPSVMQAQQIPVMYSPVDVAPVYSAAPQCQFVLVPTGSLRSATGPFF